MLSFRICLIFFGYGSIRISSCRILQAFWSTNDIELNGKYLSRSLPVSTRTISINRERITREKLECLAPSSTRTDTYHLQEEEGPLFRCVEPPGKTSRKGQGLEYYQESLFAFVHDFSCLKNEVDHLV